MSKAEASIAIMRKEVKEKFDDLKEFVFGSKCNATDFLNWLIDSNVKQLELIQKEKNKRLKEEFIDWIELHPTRSYNDFLSSKLKREVK
jgi:hypothetical protein